MNKATTLFFLVCVPVRLLLAYLVRANPEYGKYAIIPAFGFFSIYLFRLRKVGLETFGRPIWWDAYRPVHGALYLLAAVYAFRGQTRAYVPLLVDVILGIFLKLKHLKST